MRSQRFSRRILIWRNKNISERQLVIILSFIIGILSGLAAVILKNTVHATHLLLLNLFDTDFNYLYLIFPIAGITLTVLYVKYFVKDNIGHGVSRILYALSKNNGRIKPHNNYSSIISSTLTIGFGGSVGVEAPIVLTGASIGSNLGHFFRLHFKSVAVLIACGAAGAIGGIFKAPIAGLVFTLEVIMLDLTLTSIVPLLISSVTGATVAYFLMGNGVTFSVTSIQPFHLSNIPYYILLGILCGLVSFYFTKTTIKLESVLKKIKNKPTKIIIGGILLAILIFLFPSFYGEGTTTLQSLLNGSLAGLPKSQLFSFAIQNNVYLLVYFGIIVLLKVVAMAITTGSGGIGGIFGPTLFVGGVVGYWWTLLIKSLGIVQLPQSNFALAGMAGLMAGVMHAPLTAIFLIAEITGGYGLFIPLMITATISYITIQLFSKHSIYTQRLAERGELLTHHKDEVVLTLMKLEKVIENDFSTIHPYDTLGDLVQVISKSKRNIFPVISEENELIGIVLLDSIREIMFDREKYNDTLVFDVMNTPPEIVDISDSMDMVMKKFTVSGAWNLPVIKDGKYFGFVSKSKIFNSYRDMLVEVSEY
ncbi:MAG: chloride channel protein [Bacteroidetes bacterium GWC2_33_15]|nr:MAG: chloride channel protein [Bacteroidetes bacterium GWA2_33_15]OFX50038.1 MAG: chloride channel protein [Bacteroidetes bacterium GWC2_33_15]OFX65191.1 MAG: chloride channel protein [Bacteroidetes bacterium GWB2_32_14]OFX70417.1 MAG: chloride channel protein [Bacteroidetes bacterium GWD2_33_33]HAN19715.1 chloride channel protein [Bacteroidales bacterium]